MINSFNQGHPSVFNVKWPLDFDYPAAIRSKIAVYLVFICTFTNTHRDGARHPRHLNARVGVLLLLK